MQDQFTNTLTKHKHLFDGNKQRCLELYRALCLNSVTNKFVEYYYSRLTASAICAKLYGTNDDRMFFLSELEGEVSSDIRGVLADIGEGWIINTREKP